MLTLIATLVLLGVLIFVHELGHFLTAKAVDIRVPRFSIGFGPKIFGFRCGETEYVLSWIPLGGYVKMAGMDEMEAIEGKDAVAGPPGTNPEGRTTVAVPITDAGIADVEEYDDVERHFESKSLPARFLVISAGVLMNFLFAAITWSVIAGVWGVPEEEAPIVGTVRTASLPAGAESLGDLPPNTRVVAVGAEPVSTREELIQAIATLPAGPVTFDFGDAGTRTIDLQSSEEDRQALLQAMVPPWPAVIAEVLPGEPAEEGGLQAGDSVVRAAGQEIDGYLALVQIIESNPGRPVPMTVERDGRLVELTITPSEEVDAESGEEIGRVGIMSEVPEVPRERLGLFASIGHGFGEVVGWTGYIIESLGRLVTGKESVRNLGGPVLIGDLAGQFARAGLPHFLNFMAIFSVNLAVLNLLPIPVLDGGHLLFLAIEGIRGRALSIKQRMRLSQVGLVILVAIMVLALANDLLRVVERVVGG